MLSCQRDASRSGFLEGDVVGQELGERADGRSGGAGRREEWACVAGLSFFRFSEASFSISEFFLLGSRKAKENAGPLSEAKQHQRRAAGEGKKVDAPTASSKESDVERALLLPFLSPSERRGGPVEALGAQVREHHGSDVSVGDLSSRGRGGCCALLLDDSSAIAAVRLHFVSRKEE